MVIYPTSDHATATSKIMALLRSQQFSVLYDIPSRTGAQGIENFAQRCDSLQTLISKSSDQTALAEAVRIIDNDFVPSLPLTELRQIIHAIIEKDLNLTQHMPQFREMLRQTSRALEVSMVFDATVLDRLTQDLVNQERSGNLVG